MNSFLPDFSHIYIEKRAGNYPLAEKIIKKFPRAVILEIEDYKSVFNRPGQDFQIQKKSMKLILALKKPPYIYDCGKLIQSGGYDNFYYVTPILNCLYNCDYCFLQGMYPSANMVVFVNESDVFSAVSKSISARKFPDDPMLLSISYNTDLLAFENILQLSKSWIEFCKKTPDLKLEIRTKSALFQTLEEVKPTDKVILSWTLSPQEIITKHEFNTPGLNRRIKAAKAAINKGWKIRICFDPVIKSFNWQDIYTDFFDYVFRILPAAGILDVTTGLFRMNRDYFKQIRKSSPASVLYYKNYEIKDNVIGSGTGKKDLEFILKQLSKYLTPEKIIF